ncbi:unnamed protein product, partial [Closterium sp. NIES-53]
LSPLGRPVAPSPSLVGPLAALAARVLPAIGPPTAPAARAAHRPLSARQPPLPHARCPLVARQPPLPPASRQISARQLSLLPARCPLKARLPPVAAHASPLVSCAPPLAACALPSRSPLAPPPSALPGFCPPCLYLLSDSRDSVSLFDHTSGAAPAPPATADSATRLQWLTRDAAARLAIRIHVSLAECAHFKQQRTAQALYDSVVARYSSPATAALGRLLLPYLFPEQSAFAIVEDLVSHLRASDACYRAAASAEDHFLSLDPTVLTIDLLKQHLLATETGAVAVGAARGTLCTPFFEGCSPSPLAPSYASAAAVDVPSAEDIGAASASAKRRSNKGKGGRGGGRGSGGGGGGSSGGGGGSGSGGSSGSGGGSGGFGGGSGGSGGSGSSGSSGSGCSRIGAQRGGSGGGQR